MRVDSVSELERLDRIDHQLAVRAHAAWNAKDAIGPLEERPWLVITDLFGDGAPDEMFNVEVERSKDFAEEDDWNLGGPNRHGYHACTKAIPRCATRSSAAVAAEPLSR